MHHVSDYTPVGQPVIVNGQMLPQYQQQSPPPPYYYAPQSPAQAPLTPEKPKQKKTPFSPSTNEGPKLIYNADFTTGNLSLNVSVKHIVSSFYSF